jgi:hypothetical protein
MYTIRRNVYFLFPFHFMTTLDGKSWNLIAAMTGIDEKLPGVSIPLLPFVFSHIPVLLIPSLFIFCSGRMLSRAMLSISHILFYDRHQYNYNNNFEIEVIHFVECTAQGRHI